jgi:hypothetical protein
VPENESEISRQHEISNNESENYQQVLAEAASDFELLFEYWRFTGAETVWGQ